MIVGGAGGPGALQTSPPARRPKSVDTNPHAALAGLTCRTPFDCIAIAPCCFAKRKAVLSHALAALTALVPVRRPGDVEIPLAAIIALGPVRRQSRCGNSSRDAYHAWAREKAGVMWKFLSRRLPRLYP